MRWPGAGARDLQSLMETLFADEIAHERALLVGFGTVSIASFREEI